MSTFAHLAAPSAPLVPQHSKRVVRRSIAPLRAPQRLGEMSARRAWSAAVQLREAVHLRIVAAFRRQLEGTGAGPADVELRLFARIAVVEERLRRALRRSRSFPPCAAGAPAILRTAALLRRGEFQ